MLLRVDSYTIHRLSTDISIWWVPKIMRYVYSSKRKDVDYRSCSGNDIGIQYLTFILFGFSRFSNIIHLSNEHQYETSWTAAADVINNKLGYAVLQPEWDYNFWCGFIVDWTYSSFCNNFRIIGLRYANLAVHGIGATKWITMYKSISSFDCNIQEAAACVEKYIYWTLEYIYREYT